MTDKEPDWYAVSRNGMATLCKDLADAQKTVSDADIAWPSMAPHRAVQLVDFVELRRQHQRIAELEAKLVQPANSVSYAEIKTALAANELPPNGERIEFMRTALETFLSNRAQPVEPVAELEVLRKHAERYQLLRLHVTSVRFPEIPVPGGWGPNELDIAVDRAIAQAVQ